MRLVPAQQFDRLRNTFDSDSLLLRSIVDTAAHFDLVES
jgi:hypothetical protein